MLKSDKTIPKSNEFNRKLKTIKTVYGETNIQIKKSMKVDS